MTDFRLSKEAKADLREITKYSKEVWGKDQARKYMASLQDRFRDMAAKMPAGKNRDDLYPGLRSVNHARHVIYYFTDEAGLRIARILHGAMDPRLHFELSE